MHATYLHQLYILHHSMSVLMEGGPQVNKFEEVSSDGHQMSLAGALLLEVWCEVPCPGAMVGVSRCHVEIS